MTNYTTQNPAAMPGYGDTATWPFNLRPSSDDLWRERETESVYDEVEHALTKAGLKTVWDILDCSAALETAIEAEVDERLERRKSL